MGRNRVKDGAGNDVTLERVEEFYAFLRGADIDGMTLGRSRPRLSGRAAFAVIYVLQEHMDLVPDKFERCTRCDDLFDSEREGDNTNGRSRCEGCMDYR